MCGIVGIHGHESAAEAARLGLYALQHRGQESAGIVSLDDKGGARAVKTMGLVSDGLSAAATGTLSGTVAIGHTRYSTAGSSTIENAQPVLARVRDGHVALAHNGNLTNATELRRALEDDGAIFTSTMDSEVLVHRIARSRATEPEARLADALEGVEGAYSLVVMIGETLLAARDPRGWRPLVMGKLGDASIFASESCALDIIGATPVREVERGEIVAVDRSGMRSSHPLPEKESRKCVFEYVYFARPDSRVFGGSGERHEGETRLRQSRLAATSPAPAPHASA
jgi:amidophosphoribosyltransferase